LSAMARGAGLDEGCGAVCVAALGAAATGGGASGARRGGAAAGTRATAGFPGEGSEAVRLPNMA
jgi:hypothetical protein